MVSNATETKAMFSFNWYESLQFKIAAIFLILFMFISLSIFMILKTFGDRIIEDQAYLRLNQANSRVISELERHTVLSATLVQVMANVAENLPNDISLYHTLIPKIINHKGAQTYITGGGIWPAPYRFNKNVERHSFFWARNSFKKLVFYNDYNLQQGNGYHHEEWYVPTTYLLEDAVYWSKSYTDPYSLEAMVTVSAPLIKQKKNIGVATIDLKLQGLQALLKQVADAFDGYAFALDRNGTFLSYPNIEEVMSTKNDIQSFINYQDLAKKIPEFSPFVEILNNTKYVTQQQTIQSKNSIDRLANKLTMESPQINKQEAQLIATSIHYPRRNYTNSSSNTINLLIEKDPLINQRAFVAITEMPDTYWKIITVMPYSKGVEKVSATYQRLMLSTLIALLLTIFIIWLFIRYIVTNPISSLAKQVQFQLDNNSATITLFNTSTKGELRALVNIFNLRTNQLLNSQKKIEKLAHFDTLTGLPNRLSLINCLMAELAIGNKEQGYGALLFIDLDNFKRINDSLGHNIGDDLLVHLAKRFIDCVNKEDIVARLGGDEFVVLIMRKYTYARKLTHDATSTAQKLVDVMKAPILLNGQPHHMTISIGITIFANQNCHSNELLRQADTAMYHAKDKGKNCFCLFNIDMQENAYRRIEIEEALRLALKERKLFLLYQPQVDAKGNCLGVEALTRWRHPEKGMLPPSEFVHIAEKYGLILELGEWVLETACAQLRRWSDENIPINNISINVSPEQFRDINFVSCIRKTIAKYQLKPEQITLEITEGVVIDSIKDTIYKMKLLNSFGVQLAIDDFGIGYSSLRYLTELPINQLKLHQSFTREIINQPKNAMIVNTIVNMAKHLQFDLIAEGVEDKQQLVKLIEQGCEKFQGFYFSKPQTATEISDYVKRHVLD